MRKIAFAFVGLLAAGTIANAAPARIRGTITAVNGDVLTVKSRDGSQITLKLQPGYTVGTIKKATLADIKKNDFIGATTVPSKNGQAVALEVHIFPAGRKPAARSFPFDLAPNSTMTNAEVTGDVKSEDGRRLTLTYPGGQKTFIVSSRTPIVFNVKGERADVKPGVGISATATKTSDGSYETNRVTVGRNGLNPT